MAEEKHFENRIKAFLKDEGCWFVKYWAGAAYTKSGIPDILVCCGGYFLGVEVKASHGRPSELQLYNLKKIDDAGGYAILLYPDDFEIFKMLTRSLKANSTASMRYLYEQLKTRWNEEG